ncbi:hypothetical protein Y032_0015g2633 [Ancylostoma ceylanicum]|uniref:Uncharacterized protein n=1 Tax=Ancylostoma ceylanicum TaxID=53326 RepID=A0A016V8Q6_9BILA|nr:hypothetical protein Y032_0015g2633 [Ancylostoma ceylanicum]
MVLWANSSRQSTRRGGAEKNVNCPAPREGAITTLEVRDLEKTPKIVLFGGVEPKQRTLRQCGTNAKEKKFSLRPQCGRVFR